MKSLFKIIPALALALAVGFTSCSKDDEPDGSDPGSSSQPSGDYGELGGNLISVGSIKNVTYTSAVILGTVDFPKITSDHTYGIVVMEALVDPEFDYDSKLIYGGHSDKFDKEDYECEHQQITSSAADGKFEKQLVRLKPATTYYYRAYVAVGQNVNYSDVEHFTTLDPAPEITLSTGDATSVYAVSASLSGVCAVGKLQDVNEDQAYGFIYTSSPALATADKLTYEYYEQWKHNHFETEALPGEPDEVTTPVNLNGRINCPIEDLRPGMTYYYRTFFMWNGKYFYSPEVKSVTTNGTDKITVGTNRPEDVTDESATLKGSVPFSLIGMSEVKAGFMISSKYSNASEFNRESEDVIRWNNRFSRSEADVYYIEDDIDKAEFAMGISGLAPQTTYYVVAYVYLGEYPVADGALDINGEVKTEDIYIYGPVQSFTTEESDEPEYETGFSCYSDSAYPWYQEGMCWKSGNAGRHSTSSTLVISVDHTDRQVLSFDLVVSSESGYDKVRVESNGQEFVNISGEDSKEVRLTLNGQGNTRIEVTYSKDGSSSYGEDCAKVWNITLE